MKSFQTGNTIKLRNIDDIKDLSIGESFFNYIRDIAHPTYRLLELKYVFRGYECDNPCKENSKEYNYTIIEEVSKEKFYDRYDDYFTCFYEQYELNYCCEKAVIAIIKNIETGEIFEDVQEKHVDEYSCVQFRSEFIEWSSKNEGDAFDLADWWFKKNK